MKRDSRPPDVPPPILRGWPLLILAIACLAAYANSFSGPFIFDDHSSIVENLNIRRWWPPWQAMAAPPLVFMAPRPLVNWSFAINYAVSGMEVWSYHAVNVTIHLLAALALFGLVRRTLSMRPWAMRYGARVNGLALAVALLWALHPLQTESVTYIVQRAESLIGLWYLLTLYCVCRSATAMRAAWRWRACAILACAAGMASKPIMVTAPLVAFLYDRVFLATSFSHAWRLRKSLYVGLASTWMVLAILLASSESDPTVGPGFKPFGSLKYFEAQPAVILHYLKLVFWPHPLVLDYDWQFATTVSGVLLPFLGLGLLLAATIWAWRRNRTVGFFAASFWILLAPTSTFLPIADLAFEHRMYLPLAPLIALLVVGVDHFLQRVSASPVIRRRLAGTVLACVALGLGTTTVLRNRDYQSEEAIWRSVVKARPTNPRALVNVGIAVARQDRLAEAMAFYEQALRVKPDYALTHHNLGIALFKQGRKDEAIAHYKAALQSDPNYLKAYNSLGSAVYEQGQYEEAMHYYAEAVRLQPMYAEAHNNLGLALTQLNRLTEAIAQFRHALQVRPDYVDAHTNLGVVLAQQGKLQEALTHLEIAVQLQPDNAAAQNNLQYLRSTLHTPDASSGQ